MFVPESKWHERDVARSAREEVFTLGERGVQDLKNDASLHENTNKFDRA